MKYSLIGAGALVALIGTFSVDSGYAQDRVIPVPPEPTAWTLLTPHAVRAKATLRDQTARVVVEQDYVNPTGRPLEGTVCFPLARDASISDFAMYVDG